MNSNDTLQHFGIKGMRWGHRNRREALTKKYIAKGYNPKAAREKSKKRISTEGKLKKAALIGGGVALAARMSKMNADIDSMLNDLLGKASTTRRGSNGRRIKDVTNSLKG